MKSEEELFNILKTKFNENVIKLVKQPIDPFIICDPLMINEISLYLLSNEELLFDNLMNLSGVDDANGKSTPIEGIATIEGGTLSVYYHLESTKFRHKVVLKVCTPREKPEVASVALVWRSADWHEREAYDLLGIKFLNHPDLRRILMPYDWEAGYPLRKDYANPEFYHGMKVPY
ncbi:MAG: NADH-quinone oxidoreductase subunit C [Ignavibacteriaceae bacterium]|nr:NADH-quinone oxidoreductase subunit C [Ignavibacteriaceae bacterium]